MKPWLILGHYGGHNTGDEAMLTGLVTACTPALRNRLLVVSKDAALPAVIARLGVQAIPATWRPVLHAFLHSYGLVLAGGSHFQDDYSGMRYVRHYRYMARFVILSILARLLGKRVIWLSMGFGPFFRSPTRLITRLGLRFCQHVTVREATSAQGIQPWIAPDRMTHAFDLAGLLAALPAPPSRTAHPPPTITLGVSVLSVQSTHTGGPQVDQLFWQRLAAALSWVLAQQPHVRIRIFIIRGGQREDDVALSALLYRTLVETAAARVELIPHCPDPTLTLHKMRECQAFIATRFHAGVLSYLAGCRLAFLVYHRKLADLAQEIGLGERACIALTAQTTDDTLRERISELLAGAAPYQPTLPIATAIARARLNIEVLQKYS